MPPEVVGALSLACRICSKLSRVQSPFCDLKRYKTKEHLRRLREKVQKHIARAIKYQKNRP